MLRNSLLTIAFLAGLVLLDRVIGVSLRAAYDRTSTGAAGGQINDALRNADRDVIVFGSSLARYQVDPATLARQLGGTAFNAGCDGQDIYYARMLESLLLKRECDSDHFMYVLNWRDLLQEDLDRARMFSVFIDESPAIRRILASSLAQRIKLQSHAYRFNTLAISTLRQLVAPEYEGVNGFVSIPLAYQSSPRDFTDMDRDLTAGPTPEELAVMDHKLPLYRQFATAARCHDIDVTFVVSPTFRGGRTQGRGERMILNRLREIARDTRAGFIVLDETTVPAFRDVEYFGDPRHLNARGAALFSDLLAERLRVGQADVAKKQHLDDS